MPEIVKNPHVKRHCRTITRLLLSLVEFLYHTLARFMLVKIHTETPFTFRKTCPLNNTLPTLQSSDIFTNNIQVNDTLTRAQIMLSLVNMSPRATSLDRSNMARQLKSHKTNQTRQER